MKVLDLLVTMSVQAPKLVFPVLPAVKNALMETVVNDVSLARLMIPPQTPALTALTTARLVTLPLDAQNVIADILCPLTKQNV